jgi:hypothetical protein
VEEHPHAAEGTIRGATGLIVMRSRRSGIGVLLAHSDGRVLVTLDKDFGELAIMKGAPHAGIVRLVGIRARDLGPAGVQVLVASAQSAFAHGEPGDVVARGRRVAPALAGGALSPRVRAFRDHLRDALSEVAGAGGADLAVEGP